MNTTNPIKLSILDLDTGADLGPMYFCCLPDVGDRLTPKDLPYIYQIIHRSHWHIDEEFGCTLEVRKV